MCWKARAARGGGGMEKEERKGRATDEGKVLACEFETVLFLVINFFLESATGTMTSGLSTD